MWACFPVDLVLNQFTLAKFPSILTFQLTLIRIYSVCKRGAERAFAHPAVTWPFVGNDASSIGSRDVKILNILSHVPVMEPQGIFWQGLVSSDQKHFLSLFPLFFSLFYLFLIYKHNQGTNTTDKRHKYTLNTNLNNSDNNHCLKK